MYSFKNLGYVCPYTQDEDDILKKYYQKMIDRNSIYLHDIFCKRSDDVTLTMPFSDEFDIYVKSSDIDNVIQLYCNEYCEKMLQQLTKCITKNIVYMSDINFSNFMQYLNEISAQFRINTKQPLKGSQYPVFVLLLTDTLVIELLQCGIDITAVSKHGYEIYICNNELFSKIFPCCNGLMFLYQNIGTYMINYNYPVINYTFDENNNKIYEFYGKTDTISKYTGYGTQIFGLEIPINHNFTTENIKTN